MRYSEPEFADVVNLEMESCNKTNSLLNKLDDVYHTSSSWGNMEGINNFQDNGETSITQFWLP